MRQREYVSTSNSRGVTVLDDVDIDTFNVGFKNCCDFTEAEDASIGMNQEVPPPDELLADIHSLKDWADKIKEKCNQQPKS